MHASLPTEQNALTAFFDRAPLGFSLLDGNLRYIRINSTLARINGMPVEDHIGRLQHELVPEVDDIIAKIQRRVIEGEEGVSHTVRVETPAHPGVIRKFEVDYFPIPDGDGGNLVGCCVYETPESDKLVSALDREERQARPTADILKFFLATLAPDGTVRDVNAPALEVIGSTLSEAQGQTLWDCPWWAYDEGVRATIRDAVEAAKNGELRRFDIATDVRDGGRIDVDLQFLPLVRDGTGIAEIVVSGVDVTEQRELERQREIQRAEYRHRVQNMFATVQSLSRLIASRSTDLETFQEQFDTRIIALARANDAVMQTDWNDMEVRDLIEPELAPYIESSQSSAIKKLAVVIEGPSCKVAAKHAPTLSLAVHELATNAAKYGALTGEGGVVTITLDVDEDGMLSEFCWQERDGPPVGPVTRNGFGSVLLERIVPGALGLKATLEPDHAGVCYRLR